MQLLVVAAIISSFIASFIACFILLVIAALQLGPMLYHTEFIKAQYTPPTPTRRNCRVASSRRCVLGIRHTGSKMLNRLVNGIVLW